MKKLKFSSALVVLSILSLYVGCQKPSERRLEADRVAYRIIEQTQKEVLGKSEEFSIERPADILRRRLLIDQNLPVSAEASLGSGKLETIAHWPEENYPPADPETDPNSVQTRNEPITMNLLDCLGIGARNSFEYQDAKEAVFKAALELDLEADYFRNTFTGQTSGLASTSGGGDAWIRVP